MAPGKRRKGDAAMAPGNRRKGAAMAPPKSKRTRLQPKQARKNIEAFLAEAEAAEGSFLHHDQTAALRTVMEALERQHKKAKKETAAAMHPPN